jgi:RNA polymerase sigma factor (sigma-70 family)
MSAKLGIEAARDLQTLFQLGRASAWTDGLLLEQFRSGPGPAAEAAFATLVTRHGPMVLRVCRGVLNDEHDSQDAFQATFLVLVRKAGTVRNLSSVASWLYGVAHRVSSRAKVEAARRRAHERRAATRTLELRLDTVDEALAGSLAGHPAVDEEIRRLPEKYRAPVVLCYLEGLTQEQAAEQLGWPSGTVRGRLSRARELLRDRLARRGLLASAGAVASGIAHRDASAAVVPPALFDATVRAALLVNAQKAVVGAVSVSVAALAEGTARAMSVTRLKLPLLLLGLGLVTTSAAGLGGRQAPPPEPALAEQPKLAARPVSRSETPLEPKLAPSPIEPVPDTNPTAVALQVGGIVVDGDLSDWPGHMKRYPIALGNGQGQWNRDLADASKASATPSVFSVAYDPKDQRIYLAVVVSDPFEVVGNEDPFHTDAVEVFVDGLRSTRRIARLSTGDFWGELRAEKMPVLQYAGIPDRGAAYHDPRGANPSLVYGNIGKTRTTMAWSRKNGVITYEWAIEVFDRYPDRPTKLEEGKRIGFDIAVLDQNFPAPSPPGSIPSKDMLPTYTCWAPWTGEFKGGSAASLGELVLGGTR